MKKYDIKIEGKDFFRASDTLGIGSRKKFLAFDDINDKLYIFKYEKENYFTTESCSEKMSFEIAKVLDYNCAHVELARDKDGTLGILSEFFVELENNFHIDAKLFLKKEFVDRKDFYNLSNIKNTIDFLNPTMFNNFIKLMIFDALIGEQDRHEENWGFTFSKDNDVSFSPFYDNGDNLLNKFCDENYAKKYYGDAAFDKYIRRSKTLIYKEGLNSKFRHFELIEYLYLNYKDIVYNEIVNLNKLTNEIISYIVNKIPNDLLTNIHKEYIIKYIIKRRDILLDIIK